MDIEIITKSIFNELSNLSKSDPNERLPKEEQTRSVVFASIRSLYNFVSVERGYGSVDVGKRTECDIWAKNLGQTDLWAEIKHGWSLDPGFWNNKPSEQFGSWIADISKLQEVPLGSDRYFILVGFFDFNPSSQQRPEPKSLLDKIRFLYPQQRIKEESMPFTWPNGPSIAYAGIWIWYWPSGKEIEDFI